MFFKKLFSKDGDDDPRPKKIVKFEKKIMNMYLQRADRQYYMSQLAQIGTPEALHALMKRFTCACENSTVDRDEKTLTHQMLIDAGPDAIEVVKGYLRAQHQNVNWPFRVLRALITQENYVSFLVELLESIGPDYVRYPEKKEQMMLTAKEFPEDRVTKALLPYLDDDNETIRYNAAEALITHSKPMVVAPLEVRLREEDSARILQHICEAFIKNNWKVENIADTEPFLPDGYRIIRSGIIKKR